MLREAMVTAGSNQAASGSNRSVSRSTASPKVKTMLCQCGHHADLHEQEGVCLMADCPCLEVHYPALVYNPKQEGGTWQRQKLSLTRTL